MSTNVNIGNSYNLSVTAGTCGGNYTKYGKVFIDYNQDLDFLDPGEEVFAFGPAASTNTFNTSITIPFTALIGPTRMRVVVTETGSTAGVLSCGTYAWGETEDYTVVISPSAPDDMGVTNISAPNSGCSLTSTEQITVQVTNLGTNSQSAWTVSYRVNGGPVVTEPMTGPLASATSVNHTFATTANMGTPGTYTIKSWATLTGDTIPGNDTTIKVVTAVPGVSTYPYIEDFESGNGGWLPGGTSSTWAYGLPAKTTIIGASSGVNAYVTGGLGTGDYVNNEDSWVLGPCFDFSTLANPWISLRIWWNSEFSWDGSNLQYSTDFGLTWNNVGAFGNPGNWYNDNTITGNPGGSPEGWSGRTSSNNGSNGWVTAAHRLDGLAGQSSVRLRITFASDGSVTDDGFAFDDIKISEGPVANLGNDTLICGGDSLMLNPGTFSTYFWSNGATTQLDTITQSNVGTIWVKVTDSLGFYDFDTILVQLSNPIVNIGPDSSICPGDSVFLDAGNHPWGSFLWNTGDTTQTIFVSNGGTYSVMVTDSVGCQKSDNMVLNVLIPPSLNLGNDTTVCINNPVALDAGGGPSGTVYQWSNGATTQVILVSSAGQYIASVTTPGGCAAIDTVNVYNLPSPGVTLGPDRIECGDYILDAGAGNTSYNWSTGATSQAINLSTGGTYSVTVTNSFGCSDLDTVNITMGTVPVVNIGNDTIICNGSTLVLNAGNPGSTYLWSTAATTQTISVTTAAVYIVQVTNTDGCIGTDTIDVSSSNLSVNLGPDINICGNGGVYLNAGNPGQLYNWSNGSTTQVIFINTPGTYTVTVTDQFGCNATDVVNVGQVPGIAAGINAPATGILYFPVQFNDASSPSPVSWEWDFGDASTSTVQNPTHAYNAFGVYTVTLIVDDGSCRDTTTHDIDINQFVDIENEFGAAVFELYPNPSSGTFHLNMEFVKRTDISVSVMDLSGKVLFRDDLNAASVYNKNIDLGNVAEGIYILRLKAGNNTRHEKLIIQR